MIYTDSLSELIKANRDAKILKIEAIKLPVKEEAEIYIFFFCGAVVDQRGHIIGIPSKYPHIIDIDTHTGTISQWGKLEMGDLKGWAGGCLLKDGSICAFPRGSSVFLKIDTKNRLIEEIPIGISYDEDHHYGGALNSNGIIFCPPRWHGNVLKFNTNTGKISEISLPEHLPDNDSFYGAVVDQNDNIYFFPRGGEVRVLKCGSEGKLNFIGDIMKDVHFNSGCLGPDGDVYGFGAYKNGILHIDTKKDTTEVLEVDFCGGYFGAKLGFNGKIYGVPGNADSVVEFDPEKKKIQSFIDLPPVQKGRGAKCAGGAVDRFGNIWCMPAMGEYIYKVCFEGIEALPSEELYRSLYFRSVY